MKMKCRYCGANISFNDEKCPYCGKINKLAEKHVAEKKVYEKDLEQTAGVVKKRSKASQDILVRVYVLLGLVAVFGLLVVLALSYSRYTYENKRKEAIANYDQVEETMLDYWAKEEYYQFYEYCNYYQLTGWTAGPFSEYYPLMENARCYMFVNDHIAKYLSAEDVYTRNEELEDVCGLLDEVYDTSSMSYEVKDLIDPAEIEKLLSEIHNNLDGILQTYFYLTDEDLQNRDTMTADDWQRLIEKRIEEKEGK